jgi:transaldolase
MASRGAGGIAGRVRQIILSYVEGKERTGLFSSKPLWAGLRGCGSELWLDTGDMDEAAALWCREFSALTTNNTLLNKEVQKGIYDDLIAQAAGRLSDKLPQDELVLETAFVLNAVHGLRLSRVFSARVSVELHTDLANDVDRTLHYARRYHEIAPDRFIVKVPMSPAGLIAARQLSEDGIPVNFTLGFSARQNYVITVIARPAFVNVFLGRLNAFVDDNGLGSGDMVGEKAALASQRIVAGLRDELDLHTRQIAASIRAPEQVSTLAGIDVLTMPTKVAAGFEKLNVPMSEIRPGTGADPQIELNAGVDRQAVGIDCLWDVPEEFRAVVGKLDRRSPAAMTAAELPAFFAKRGLAGFLPAWSEQDAAAASGDGKIPNYERWKDRMAGRQADLDALMSLSGLQSFAADQRAMDDRIRERL